MPGRGAIVFRARVVRCWGGGRFKVASLLVALSAVVLSSCAGAAREDLTRRAASSVISRTLVTQYPDLQLQPMLDCVINNATSAELIGLASDTVTGPTASTGATVAVILARPGAVRCLAAQSAGSLAP